MKIKNEASKTVEIRYYGKEAIIKAGKSLEIAFERIGDFITVQSEEGEVSIFRFTNCNWDWQLESLDWQITYGGNHP